MHYRARLRPPWLLLVCIGLIALNMRGPIVAVAPVLGLMEADLHFSAVGLGLLTGIPVLCFAVASPLASRIGRRLGAEFAVTLTLFGVLMGTVVRSIGTGVPVVFGTALIGIAITVGNIAVPLIIRRDFSVHRQGTAMGVYTAALNVGSFVTSVATVPLALELGWRAALACGGLLAILGLLTWIVVVGRRRALVPAEQHVPMTDTTGSHGSPWITFGLTASFAAQGFSYYGITAWLPTFLMDVVSLEPAVAGAGSSIFQILAIVGALGVPLAVKFTAPRTVAIVLGALWLAVPVGLLLAPRLWWLWAGSGGVAQGGGITLIFLAIIRLARDQATAGRMSAIVQGVGYCLAALAPTAIGYVHTRTGNWAAPLLVILCSVAVFITGTTLSLRKMPGHR